MWFKDLQFSKSYALFDKVTLLQPSQTIINTSMESFQINFHIFPLLKFLFHRRLFNGTISAREWWIQRSKGKNSHFDSYCISSARFRCIWMWGVRIQSGPLCIDKLFSYPLKSGDGGHGRATGGIKYGCSVNLADDGSQGVEKHQSSSGSF